MENIEKLTKVSPALLERALKSGVIKEEKVRGGRRLLTVSPEHKIRAEWNPVTVICNGIVVNDSYDVLSRPPRHYFSLHHYDSLEGFYGKGSVLQTVPRGVQLQVFNEGHKWRVHLLNRFARKSEYGGIVKYFIEPVHKANISKDYTYIFTVEETVDEQFYHLTGVYSNLKEANGNSNLLIAEDFRGEGYDQSIEELGKMFHVVLPDLQFEKFGLTKTDFKRDQEFINESEETDRYQIRHIVETGEQIILKPLAFTNKTAEGLGLSKKDLFEDVFINKGEGGLLGYVKRKDIENLEEDVIHWMYNTVEDLKRKGSEEYSRIRNGAIDTLKSQRVKNEFIETLEDNGWSKEEVDLAYKATVGGPEDMEEIKNWIDSKLLKSLS